MKVLWLCNLPEEVRTRALEHPLRPAPCAAMGWITGHLPPPQGVELHLVCMARGLVERELHFDYQGAHWHCFREIRGEQYILRAFVFARIFRFVRKLQPDVIDGWGGETSYGWFATLLSRHAFVNVQGLLRLYLEMLKGTDWLKKTRWLDWTLRKTIEVITYRRAYRLFTESELSHDALLSYYGRESTVIYQPLRREFLSQCASRSLPEVPTFLYLGVLEDRKGIMDGLRAFDFMKTNARLHVIGSGCLESEALRYVQSQGLADRVKFHKGLSAAEIITVMAGCDFMLLPSYGDTGPTAIKEALSQGLYPICYDNTGPKEHVERYGFGRLVATGEWEALSEAMDKACEDRKAIFTRGIKVAEKVRRDHSPENIWPQILTAYQEVLP